MVNQAYVNKPAERSTMRRNHHYLDAPVPAYKLLLLPSDPGCPCIGLERLAGCLQTIGLIGAPRRLSEGTFYPTGERFLQLVTFLGCSPMIELDPPADHATLEEASAEGRFCHVFLRETEALEFRADGQTRTAHCPECRKPVPGWQSLIRDWQRDPAHARWQCTSCGHTGQPPELRFRKTAGFGKTWVELRGIHPAEAIPAEGLLAALRGLSGCDWKALYIRE